MPYSIWPKSAPVHFLNKDFKQVLPQSQALFIIFTLCPFSHHYQEFKHNRQTSTWLKFQKLQGTLFVNLCQYSIWIQRCSSANESVFNSWKGCWLCTRKMKQPNPNWNHPLGGGQVLHSTECPQRSLWGKEHILVYPGTSLHWPNES